MLNIGAYRWDVPGFARDVLGIKLHPGQIRFANAVVKRNRNAFWRAAYLTLALSAGNRAGKTLILAIVIIHSVIFKLGLPYEGGEEAQLRWLKRPYLWFHFAIQQEIAELVFTEIVTILSGSHLAQQELGCPLADQFETQGQKPADWEKKYNGDYRWIVFAQVLGGGEVHFRTTAEKALGSLGRDMNGISFDECGFEPKLQYVVDNVLHLRRLGTGGQLLLVSTPEEGLTEFSDLWFMGDPEQPDRAPNRMSLRMSTRDNIGFGLDQEVFDSLVADMDEDHVKQNIDGYFIQGRTAYFASHSVDRSFVEGLPESTPAVNKGVYVQGVDPGLTDRCWSLVFRWDGKKLHGVKAEYSRSRTTEAIVALAVNNHSAYEVKRAAVKSYCVTAIDTTGQGGHMFRELVQQSLPEVVSVEFGGNTQAKRRLIGDLKTMLDKGEIEMPRSGDWLKVRRQLAGYKINDRKIEQDAVMALACAVKVVRRLPLTSMASVDFNAFAVDEEKPVLKPNFRRRRHSFMLT